MVLAKRQALERNQRPTEDVENIKDRKFGILRRGPFRLAPPFAVSPARLQSQRKLMMKEVEVIWVSCRAGEGMRSEEYMVVKAKEDEWQKDARHVRWSSKYSIQLNSVTPPADRKAGPSLVPNQYARQLETE